jgi:hypothetical protein
MHCGQVVDVDSFDTFRGVNARGHGDTPSRRILHMRRELPLAEPSARRHWCDVEGGIVLSPKFMISGGQYRVSLD